MDGAGFQSEEDAQLEARFMGKGYLIYSVEAPEALDRIRNRIAELAAKQLGLPVPDNVGDFLNSVHRHVTVEGLNALRLAVINGLRQTDWFRSHYYALVQKALASLVGNELAMQRGFGLSIQLPDDSSSLLPIHTDVWDGDSPYELVVWLPLVNCYRTKSMYIVPIAHDRDVQHRLSEYQRGGSEDLYHAVKKHAEFLDIKYGQVLLFSQTLMHGNRVNLEPETRWSMNCRFKSLFSPYADKKLGEFFEPITIRPVTRIGADYRLPGGFRE